MVLVGVVVVLVLLVGVVVVLVPLVGLAVVSSPDEPLVQPFKTAAIPTTARMDFIILGILVS